MDFYEGDNIGGILSLDIAFYTDFISIDPAVLKAGAQWTNIPLREESGSFSEQIEYTDNGPVYTYKGGFTLTGMRAADRDELTRYLGAVSILRVRDMNLRYHIIGDLEACVTLSLSGTTGENYTNLNSLAGSFTVEMNHPSYAL